MILGIKNFFVRFWPFCVFQNKINILNDTLNKKYIYSLELENALESLKEQEIILGDKISFLEESLRRKDAIRASEQQQAQESYLLLYQEKENIEFDYNEMQNCLIDKNRIIEEIKLQIFQQEQEIISLHSQLEIVDAMQMNIQSSQFWDEHYQKNGTSGTGSYKKLSTFKAATVNNILKKKKIRTVIEFGCGDGNQLSQIQYEKYTGVDVSEFIIRKHRDLYQEDSKKLFYCTLTERDCYINKKYDLSISMDVIFHLLEDEVFEQYMNDLFYVSNKYVIIYSSNHEEFTKWPEFRHRKFMRYIQENIKGWVLTDFIPNIYPHIIGQEETTSEADFYIFKKEDSANLRIDKA